jgi:hypothetical protein
MDFVTSITIVSEQLSGNSSIVYLKMKEVRNYSIKIKYKMVNYFSTYIFVRGLDLT